MKTPVSIFSGLALLSLTLIFSATVLTYVDVVISLNQAPGNMHPGIAFVMLPFLLTPLLLIVCATHLVLSKFFHYKNSYEWACAGFLYSLVFLFFLWPWLIIIPVILNPFSARLFRKEPA
jgi:hypothetical protein